MLKGIGNKFYVGTDTYIQSTNATSEYSVFFEDNLTTGYFYAAALNPEFEIKDALHIYDVENVIDKKRQCSLKIIWNNNDDVAFLIINNYCHAIFDFTNQKGFCRNGFPPCKTKWNKSKERVLTEKIINDYLESNTLSDFSD